MNARRLGRMIVNGIRDTVAELGDNRRFAAASARYDLNGYRRAYLVHIRKTAGTSINRMFLALSGKDPDALYAELAARRGHRLVSNGLAFAAWHQRHIDRGHYFYAFSHIPFHRLALPAGTFSLSCFRDPVKRVVSHYNMLMDYRVHDTPHPCMATEGQWLGGSFSDFLDRLPREHLLNQLFTFSPRCDVGEAVANVGRLSGYLFVDDFDSGVERINVATGLQLVPVHVRRSGFHAQISDRELNRLHDMLRDEYRFLEQIRTAQHTR